MLSETEKSSDECRTASLSEMGHGQRAATSSTVTDRDQNKNGIEWIATDDERHSEDALRRFTIIIIIIIAV